MLYRFGHHAESESDVLKETAVSLVSLVSEGQSSRQCDPVVVNRRGGQISRVRASMLENGSSDPG